MLVQDIPTERADQQHVAAALLALQQEALHAAAQAADEAARHATFESYREELSYHTCRRQRADLACFMRYLDEAGVPMTATCTRLETHLADDPRLWRHITFALAAAHGRHLARPGGYIPRLHDTSAAAPLLVRTRKDGDFEEQEEAAPDGPGWTTTSLYRRVRWLGERIGIADLCPYDARHSWARGVVKAGTDIVTATKFGGWKSHSKMLARYYGEQDVVEPVKLPWE